MSPGIIHEIDKGVRYRYADVSGQGLHRIQRAGGEVAGLDQACRPPPAPLRQVRDKWELSFSRLAGVVRCAVWVRRELFAVLALMGRKRGTAGAGKTTSKSPRPLISQGFLDFPQQNVGQQAA